MNNNMGNEYGIQGNSTSNNGKKDKNRNNDDNASKDSKHNRISGDNVGSKGSIVS